MVIGVGAMPLYWVVGGEYKDTYFNKPISGEEQWFGPFSDYGAAKEEWAKHAWQTVDTCTCRYRIECIDPDVPPPCTD